MTTATTRPHRSRSALVPALCALAAAWLAPRLAAAQSCGATTCTSDTYCKGATCYPACPPCGAGERCEAGRCVADPCAALECSPSEVCDPTAHRCVPNRCFGLVPDCRGATTCNPLSGLCVESPCAGIKCPADTICKDGWCGAATPPAADMGSPFVFRLASGTGGCAVGRRSGGDVLAVLAMLLAWSGRRAVRRSRGRRISG